MGFGPLTSRHALTSAGGNVEVATNAILGGDVPEEHELEEHVVNQNWDRMLERQGLREAVDSYYRQHQLRTFQQVVVDNSDEKELFLGRHEWPAPVDTHFLKEKSSWLGISEAESQEAVTTLLGMQQAGTLLHSRVLLTKQAAKFWRFANNHADTEKHYRVGDKLVIIDLVNKVCNAEVMEVKESEKTIYIHYTGWSKKWDEWVPVNSKRIQPDFKVVRIFFCHKPSNFLQYIHAWMHMHIHVRNLSEENCILGRSVGCAGLPWQRV